MRKLLTLLAVSLAASTLLAFEPPSPASERETWNKPVPDWWQGPVRYALTDRETKDYRALTDPADRAAFIARFWAARDPSPFTPRNEAEELFWRRVSAADELFTQTTVSGWRTDRGKIYVILGPPDEITEYPVPSVAELDPTHFPIPTAPPPGNLRPGVRGAVEWIYRSLKSAYAVAGQTFTFTRDETGEYRLSGRLAATFRFELPMSYVTSQNAYARDRANNQPNGPPGGGGKFGGAAGGSSTGGPVGFAPDGSRVSADNFKQDYNQLVANTQGFMAGTEQMFSADQAAAFERFEEPEALKGMVTTTEFFGAVPIQDRIDFFKGEGGTSALLTLGVASADLREGGGEIPEVEIFGLLQKVGDPSQVFRFSATRERGDTVHLQEVAEREHRLFEVRGVIPPGTYKVSLGVRAGERYGGTVDRVEVPEFGGNALQMSGPILAEKIGASSSPEASGGFLVGRLRLLPKLEAIFKPGSEFGFYFQVYNLLPGPSDHRIHLDVEYDIAVRRQGLFVPQGKPVLLKDSDSPAHAYTFPLKGWSAGEYLLTVTVTDRVSGKVQAGSVPFLVQ